MTEPTGQQPGTAIARRPVNLDRPVYDLDDAFRLAKNLAVASVIPDDLRGKPSDVLAMVLYGQDLGLTAMQSLQAIYVVKGRPHMSGQLWIAKTREAGHRLFIPCAQCGEAREGHPKGGDHRYVADHDTEHCTVTIVRGDTGESNTSTYTIEDAKTAKLLSNDNWIKRPKTMLMWRATTENCRFICPEVALGFAVTGEESYDREPAAATVERVDEPEDIADAEIVDPAEAAAQVDKLAAEYDFSATQLPATGPAAEPEDLPAPPADYLCETCGVVGDHYMDECPRALGGPRA